MYKLFIMHGDNWHKIQLFIFASMLEVMSRVKAQELVGQENFYWQVWEPGQC